jgi:hypothetical protein
MSENMSSIQATVERTSNNLELFRDHIETALAKTTDKLNALIAVVQLHVAEPIPAASSGNNIGAVYRTCPSLVI